MQRAFLVAGLLALCVQPAFSDSLPEMTAETRPTRVAGVGLRVSDLERSMQFYTAVLGLKVAARVPAKGEPVEYLLGLTGNVREDTLVVIRKGEVKSGASAFGSITLVVPNGRKIAERVMAAGYKNARPLGDGTNFVRDPDGYMVELYQRPAAAAKSAEQPASVKVTIDSGVLVGQSRGGVNVFRGVPFAKPPVGELRWKAPQAPDKWVGERVALANEPPCPQPVNLDGSPNGGGVSGVQSEDCLYLSVFAPENANKAPVVLWLYGGGAFLGAGHLGSYDGTANAKNGVITIPINYRLGALANFSHPALTQAARANDPLGNFALTDAVAALQWIKRNAAAFGGDPDNVTIAGQSAGAVMVVNLLSIPSAQGLYHKAIIQSGALLRPAQSMQEAEQRGLEAAKALGLSEKATATELRAVSAQTLVAAEATRRGVTSPNDGRFRIVTTADALKAGTEIDVPVLVGANSGEPGFDAARSVAALTGDTGAGAWLYHFAYVPGFRRGEWQQGAIHSAELMFSFDSIDTSGWATGPLGKADAADRAVAKRVSSCWIAFYKMPANAKSLTCAEGTNWPAYTDASDDAMQFSDTARIVKSKTLPSGPPRAGS
jgi:para-nitrobenzyl esterase